MKWKIQKSENGRNYASECGRWFIKRRSATMPSTRFPYQAKTQVWDLFDYGAPLNSFALLKEAKQYAQNISSRESAQ